MDSEICIHPLKPATALYEPATLLLNHPYSAYITGISALHPSSLSSSTTDQHLSQPDRPPTNRYIRTIPPTLRAHYSACEATTGSPYISITTDALDTESQSSLYTWKQTCERSTHLASSHPRLLLIDRSIACPVRYVATSAHIYGLSYIHTFPACVGDSRCGFPSST